jgi:hypothetical protein
MKRIVFSAHAREQMAERGADQAEVEEAIRLGEEAPAKRGRTGFRRNFQYDDLWGGRRYAVKQVMAIIAEEADKIVVVTVYTFYF